MNIIYTLTLILVMLLAISIIIFCINKIRKDN